MISEQQKKKEQELIRLQTKLHQEWLKHPVTQDLLRILTVRRLKQTKDLQDGILTASDEKKEIGYRASLSAAKAIVFLAFETNTFVEELNKLTPKE